MILREKQFTVATVSVLTNKVRFKEDDSALVIEGPISAICEIKEALSKEILQHPEANIDRLFVVQTNNTCTIPAPRDCEWIVYPHKAVLLKTCYISGHD